MKSLFDFLLFGAIVSGAFLAIIGGVFLLLIGKYGEHPDRSTRQVGMAWLILGLVLWLAESMILINQHLKTF